MNDKRRAILQQAALMLSNARDKIQDCLDAEQEAFDNLPEALQEAEQGQNMQGAIEALSECVDHIGEAEGNLDDVG